ncbi:pseudouridine synthase [Phenylobacterium sp.]|uniref:pseudouridine synthase n=1 Tax=Phenylobacterium sp. TaxID=1871053 RepID=UPI0039C91DAB
MAKALARAGVASRREVERLIEAGRVALNGKTLTTPAVKVDPGDVLTVDGQVVNEAEPARVFRYHKPPGLMTTHKDPQGRPTVFEALPKDLPRLISIGRLDLNTEGLLLLTNDGGLARALELPETGLVRRYRARARGRITQERLDRLKHGITVEGVRYGPIEATLDKAREAAPGSRQGANLWITLTLSEGKNREVRRVLESLGLAVNRLIRLAYGPFALGTLAVGEIEEVGPRVIREQLAQHIASEALPKGERAQWRKPAVQAKRRGPQNDAEAERAGRRREAEAAPKKDYKPGWAKPKIKPKPAAKGKAVRVSGAKAGGAMGGPKGGGVRPSGSPRADGRPAGHRGPKPSASRPKTSGARRPGPRPGGDRGRRG